MRLQTKTPVFFFPPPSGEDQAVEHAIDWIYASLNERGSLTHGQSDRERRSPAWTRALLDALGAPDHGLPTLFVTGSKGKGSTSVLAAAALQAGAPGRGPVGLVTSPHLLRFEERIRADLRAIPGHELQTLVEAVRPVADPLRARMPLPLYASPVGATAALAAVYFRRIGARYAVYEAGRGGRFDDTAEVDHAVTVLTTLFPEHLRELGPTIEDIAWHKAGAIRSGTHTVVQGAFPAELAKIVEAEAQAVGARILTLGREVVVRREVPRAPQAASALPFQTVVVTTPFGTYDPLPLPLSGSHQADNLALALAAAEALVGKRLDGAAMAGLLAELRWPGRLEVLRDPADGITLLDASIEPGAARAAVEHARATLPGPHVAIVGIGVGKDYRAVWTALAEASIDTILTRAQNPYLRFPDPAETAQWTRENPGHRMAAPDLAAAWQMARDRVGPGGTVLILGTVSLMADALRIAGARAADLVPPAGRATSPRKGRTVPTPPDRV